MTHVFRVPYKIIGPGLDILKNHQKLIADAQAAAATVYTRHGGAGYRPDRGGKMWSILFSGADAPVPKGFRKSKYTHTGHIECLPHKTSEAGKQIAAEMAAAPPVPSAIKFAEQLGFRPKDMIIDGYKVYWPALYDFTALDGDAYLHLPRFIGDAYEPDTTLLEERKETELWAALETFNAKVRAHNERADA